MSTKFADALLASALNGELTESMAEEWLEDDDQELALKLIRDDELRRAMLYLMEKGLTIDQYQAIWRKTRNQG